MKLFILLFLFSTTVMASTVYLSANHLRDQRFPHSHRAYTIKFNEFFGSTDKFKIDQSVFTFLEGGVYSLEVEPQLKREGAAHASDTFDIWIETFEDGKWSYVVNSNIKRTAGANNSTGIAPLTSIVKLKKGDKVRFRCRVGSNSLMLKYTPPEKIRNGNIPGTPSVILTVIRLGDK